MTSYQMALKRIQYLKKTKRALRVELSKFNKPVSRWGRLIQLIKGV